MHIISSVVALTGKETGATNLLIATTTYEATVTDLVALAKQKVQCRSVYIRGARWRACLTMAPFACLKFGLFGLFF